MSAEWKVGVAGIPESLVAWDGEDWRWVDSGAPVYDQPPSMRPLVLIDPEDREQVERLVGMFYDDYYVDLNEASRSHLLIRTQVALREYASPTPPKPDEPMGLGAVVVDADGIKWVRTADDARPWMRAGTSDIAWRGYADISAVEVKSAGVES